MSSVNYNRTEKLRFWCQKVLPIVYDDSLSYYELLNKVVVYLNSTIEDVQSVIDEITSLEQSVGNKIDKTQKGVANGVATLDGTGKVPLSQLPDVSAGVQTISVNGVNVPADANRNVNIAVMTNSVSNLVNYYLKTETYNKSEVNTLIDNVKNSRFEVVAQLPTSDIQTNVIYLVPKVDGGVQDGYDEYINLDGTTSGWELIGSTDIDLSGYVTDSELATALTSYVTTQALNATLADYVSNGALATALSGYVQMSMFNALSGVVSEQGEALADRVDIFAVTQSRETGDTATTLHNVNTFVWVDKLTNIFGSHLFKVTQTVNVGDNWTSIKSSKLSDVTVSGELRDIEGKIPATASASNKLATAEDITAGIELLKDTVGWLSGNKFNKDATPDNLQGAVEAIPTATGVNIKSTQSGSWAITRYWIKVKPNTAYKITTNVVVTSGESTIYIQGSTLDNPTSYADFNVSLIDERNTGAISRTFNTGNCKWIQVGLFATRNTEELLTGDVTYSNLMIITEEQYNLNSTYRPYHGSVDEVKADKESVISALNSTVGWIGINRFNGKATTKTAQGVTWTVDANDNNIVTISGTPTGFEAFTLDSNNVLPVGDYVLSSISDMVNVVYNGVFLYKNNTMVRNLNISDDRNVHTFSILPSDDYDTIRVQLKRETNGIACSGTGKIMVVDTYAYALNPPYVPFHESVADMLTPKLLPNNADLNDYLTENEYIADANTNTYYNIPASVVSTSFRLKIMPFNVSGSRCIQIIYVNKPEPEVYMRTNFGGTWQSWYKFAGTVVS